VNIATININNVNRRLPNLLNWLDAAKPDALCLQELKAEDRQFPERVAERRLQRRLAREDVERDSYPSP